MRIVLLLVAVLAVGVSSLSIQADTADEELEVRLDPGDLGLKAIRLSS